MNVKAVLTFTFLVQFDNYAVIGEKMSNLHNTFAKSRPINEMLGRRRQFFAVRGRIMRCAQNIQENLTKERKIDRKVRRFRRTPEVNVNTP